jgi:DNA-binding NarL/FixJ family response regulator
MKHTTSIIIADDHPLLLQGHKTFLETAGYQVIDTALDGNEAYNKIIRHNPHLAILDMQMPVLTGLEVAQHLHQKQSPVKVIILSLHRSQDIFEAVGTSLHGYILKEDALDEILNCIEAVGRGETYVSPNIRGGVSSRERPEILQQLTAAELKILRQVAQKKTSQEIADALFLSPRTVEKHRENILKKLELGSGGNNLSLWALENKHLFDDLP